jgi:hypothetical protein
MKRAYIRAVAVALLILPEPFTTPFGVALLIVSFFLPKTHKDNLRNLEDMVKRYMKLANKFSSKPETMIVSNRHVTSWHEYIEKKDRAVFQNHYVNDSRLVKEKCIHHVLRTSLPQYEAKPVYDDRKTQYSFKTVQPPSGTTAYRSRLRPINMNNESTRVIHHTLRKG